MIVTTHAPDEPARQPLKDELQAAGQKIGATGREALDEAAGEAKAAAESEQTRTAERIDHVARATQRAAEELEGREDWLADAVGSAASELEGIARGVRNKNVGDLIGDLEVFGRRYPTALFGVAAAIGFGAVRFARSSTQRHGDRPLPNHSADDQLAYDHPAYAATARRID
jgi:hypothetical protein